MHQTTVRFGPDLWEALEAECAEIGVSIAQYLREAAVARMSYTAGRRKQPAYADALVAAGAVPPTAGMRLEYELAGLQAESAARLASEHGLDALAVTRQGEQVRTRAREVRAESRRLRDERTDLQWQKRR
jgi:hypothetical protein